MLQRTVLTVLTLVGATAVSGLWAQQSPVFRAAVDLITVDATVVDSRGNPIIGLGPADFELKVDGQPRAIASVQFVGRSAGAAPDAAPPRSGAATTHASSNESLANGRLVLVAVDQANIRRLEGRQALQAASRFLDSLGPADSIAVAAVNYQGDLEFSNDRPRARRQLERLTGEAVPAFVQPLFNVGLTEALSIADGSRTYLDVAVRRECGESLGRSESLARIAELGGLKDPCPIQLEQEARAYAQQVRTQASLSLNELMDMIGRLKTIDGPKTVVLLSEGLIAEPRLVDLTMLGALAQEARVTIYVLQLEVPIFEAASDRTSPTASQDIQLQADGLARLAGAARGALFRLTGSDPAPFQRIARELSGYYLLAFEATLPDRDGRPHRIALSLAGSKGTLRSRQAFRFESSSWARTLTEGRLVDLLRASSVANELPLRAASWSFYDPATGKVRVEIGGETQPAQGLAAEVLFGFVLLDSKGVIVASQVQETSTRRFSAAVIVDPGVYTLKVAALDRFGRPGSLPRAVLAGYSDSPIPTSELMIARMPVDASAALDPVVDRTSDDRVLTHLELYPPAGRSLREVDVMVSLRPAQRNDPALRLPALISSRTNGHAVARAVLPIQDLPNGRYVIRAEVVEAGRPVGFVERGLTIER